MQINCLFKREFNRARRFPFSSANTAFMLILSGLLLVTTTLSAQITVDGDPSDWECSNLVNVPIKAYVPDPFGNGMVDNQFTSSKDFFFAGGTGQGHLTWALGQTKAKNDIANASALLSGCTLYFSGDRTSNNGDAQIGFWFYLNGTAPRELKPGSGDFYPGHTVGDLFILADFTGGGRTGVVTVYKWVGTGGNVAGTNGTLSTTDIQGIIAENNDTEYPVPGCWNFVRRTYETNEFYEGQVNLCGLNLPSLCFSSFLLEARSSQEITASLDDFVAGSFAARPAVPTVVPNARCGDGPLTLTASCTGSTVRWYTSSNGRSPLISNADYTVLEGSLTINNLTATETFYVSCYNSSINCESDRVAVLAVRNQFPDANAGADKVLTCIVTSITLSGSSGTEGATFAWEASNGGHILSGANSSSPTVNAAGTYVLTVTNPATGCTATDAAVVLLDNLAPSTSAGPDKLLTCTVSSVALQGQVDYGGPLINPVQQGPRPDPVIQWVASNGGNIVSGAQTAFPVVNAAGTYTITVTDPSNGCTATDIALVFLYNNPPVVNAGTDRVLTCSTPSITLNGSIAEISYINPIQQIPSFTIVWVASNGGHIVSGANTLTPVVDAAGTYTLTVTNTFSGCTATDVAKVEEYSLVATAGPDRILTCSITTAQLLGGIVEGGINPVQQRVTIPGFEFAWVASNGGNIVSGADTQYPIVNAPGTYTVTVTSLGTGCSATDVTVVSLDNTAPDVDAGANNVICTGGSSILTGSSQTAGVGFAWMASNGGNILSGANTATPTVNAAGTYTLTVTDPANGCTATDVAVVAVNTVDAGSIAGDQVICFTDPGNPLPFRNEVPATGSGDITYQWVSNTAGCNGPWTLIPGATAPGFDSFVLPLSLDTYYKRVSISTLNGVICRDSSNCVAILSGPCSGPFPFAGCTYTQGYFGNKNGNSCDGENFYEDPVSLITALLFDPLVVGRADRERSITIPAFEAGAIKLNSILPGGKSANMLPSGNCNIADNTCIGQYLTNQGKLNNVLLSQTIVLSLNARINGGVLARLPITNGWLTTRDQKGCGESATEVECVEGSEAIRSILMNENVANYLTDFEENTADVNDLIELANDLLGGALFPGQVGANGNVIPSYSDVNAAIDAVNNAFDGCRTALGYYECPKNCDNFTLSCEPLISLKTPGKPVTSEPRESEFGTKQLNIVAYPNPFVDAVNLRVKSPVSGLARIELFDPTGTRLSVSSRYLVADVETVIGLKGIIPASSLHYRLSIGGYTASGIAIKVK